MKSKKILFITNIAGKKINTFSLASIGVSSKNDLEFHIAGNFKNSSKEQQRKDEEKYKIKIHQIDFERNPLHPKNLIAFKQLIELMKKEKFDIVHCNTPVGGVYGRIAAKICGMKKVIYQAHGFHFYRGSSKLNWLVYYPIEKMLAHLTDALVTINFEDYNISKKFKLRNGGKSYYVPGVGIDGKIYKNIKFDKEIFKEKLGLKKTDIICISMGDLILRKNYKTAIEAISKTNNKNIHYLICGKGPEEENLKKLSRILNVEDQIHFLGFRSDVKELLRISDIFLFTTLQEGMPRSMMEAMASGLPCVSSKIRGNVDLIENGKGGFLINPTDTEEFSKKINLLVNNFGLREKMKNYNFERIKSFDIRIVEKELEKIYKKVLGEYIKNEKKYINV